MDLPEAYHKAHKGIKRDCAEIFKEYSSKIKWRPNGQDTLIDVGTGPGDVFVDYVRPIIPKNIERIVLSDISPAMLDYVKARYHTQLQCEYSVLDIGTKEQLPVELEGKFDHVTSTLCLHWVQDHRTALKNMFNLLRPEGGDCLIVFMAKHSVFDTHNKMEKTSKWSKYLKNVQRFISPLNFSTDSGAEFTAMMKEVGFSEVDVKVRTSTMHYGTYENLKENLIPVCGPYKDIPLSRQSEYLDDFIQTMANDIQQNTDIDENTARCLLKYDLLVAFGRKDPIKTLK